MICRDCPRACTADRENGEIGFCGGGKYAQISKVIDSFGYEEPCLGEVTAVFFGGCALRCSYCQNHKISRGGGEVYNDAALARLFDRAENKAIDLVTPSHYLSAIERALPLCYSKHSFIYNTSGYETVDAVKRASAFADVFLTDFKYADGNLANRFSRAPNYRDTAVAALKEMRKTKDVWEGEKLKRGLIVRHLVLPNCVQNSLDVLDIIADIAGTDTVLSLMSQFTPNGVGEPSERLKKIEYKIVAEHAIKLGFNIGYFQEFSSASSMFTPDFE